MPGRLLAAFLETSPHTGHSARAPPAATFKNPFATDGRFQSTTSLSIERDKGPKAKVVKEKEKKEKKDAQRRDSFGMDALKSLAMGRKHSGEHKHGSRTPQEPDPEAKIDVDIESPPLLFIGPPTDPNGDDSSGALFSSQLRLKVLVPSISLVSYESRLICIVKHPRPVEKNCPDCITKTTELSKWTHVGGTYKRGEHSKPLQYHFKGHLPATVHGAPLASVEYRLITIARTSTGEEIKNDFEILIKRAIQAAAEKTSVRVFPPTHLIVTVRLQPIVHPIGEIPVYLRMEGLVDKTQSQDNVFRWKLRRVNWKIEETHKMVSPACAKHAGKVGGEGKGVKHEEIKTIGQAEVKDQWKTDYDDGDGKLELEFKAAINPNLRPTCAVEAPNGLSVEHQLVLEMVVAEEWAPRNKPHLHQPSGSARILRTQFNLTLTERMGIGIAWDQETPPMYEDVPPSPPVYPASPPTYRSGTVGDFDAASLTELDEETDQAHLTNEPVQHPAAREHVSARFTADDLETAEPSYLRRPREVDENDGANARPDVEAGTSTSG